MPGTYCEELIVTTAVKGTGNPGDSTRAVTEIYRKDGTLVAVSDPYTNNIRPEMILLFAKYVKKNSLDADNLTDKDVHSWLDNHRDLG